MRFTTWPALPNAFIIFTAAFLFLTPAVDAQTTSVDIFWVTPQRGQRFDAGEQSAITWDVVTGGFDLTNSTCQLSLLNSDYGYSYQLTEIIPILSATSGPITYPPDALSGTRYYISMKTSWNSYFYSPNFTIAYQ